MAAPGAAAPDTARPLPARSSSPALQQVFRAVRIGAGEPDGDESGGERRLKRFTDGLLPCHGAVGWAVGLQIGNVGWNFQVHVSRIRRNQADLTHLVETQIFGTLGFNEIQTVRPFVSPAA